MEQSVGCGARETRSMVDGSTGTTPYIEKWPTGPVPGNYEIRFDCVKATFDGGNRGALNADEWERECSADPTECGL